MSSSEPHDHLRLADLIGRLYDAALDDSLWSGLASRIAECFRSTSAVLKLHSDGGHVYLLECTGNLVAPEREESWLQEPARQGLCQSSAAEFNTARILTDEDLLTPDEWVRSSFYQDWLRHLDIHHLLGAVFPAAEGAIGVLGIHRPKAAGAYGEDERRKAAMVLPHLQRAFQIRQRFIATSQVQAASAQALDHLEIGVLMLDGACRLVHANHMAHRILRKSPELSVVRGRVTLRDASLHDRFSCRVRRALEMARGKLAKARGVLSVPRLHHAPLAIEFVPARHATTSDGGERAMVLLLIRDPEAPIAVTQLRELFGFTPTEAVVAAALGSGRSLEEISTSMGIGLATVRSHLKRILAKTGTHRQAEAVVLLARSTGLSL